MTPDRSFRSEIQGLRAIAVVSVVIFHVWPWMLPGGYVGVDVFFVISGYLITGLLVREIEATGRISILQFYERRVRRLVPAATLVLLAVALSIPLLPGSRWQDTAIENAASALYIENWRLAWLAVDYLGAENPPSPVQHYWSLSIEEQFYIFWPLLMIAGAVLARRMGAGVRTVLLALLALVTVASFVKSLVLTRTDPAQAYFVTHSRIWELGIGGLLSIARLPAPRPLVAELLRWGGLVAILAAALVLSGATAFPGYAALLPTLGCAAVILAGSASVRFSAMRLLEARPAQYVGDISYAAYLWHWPLIVFATVQIEGEMPLQVGLALIAVTIVLADLTKRHLEDRFRRPGATSPLRVVAAGAVSICACIGAAFAIYGSSALRPSSNAVAAAGSYPGPAVLLDGAPVPEVEAFMPIETDSWKDLPEAYRSGCHLNIEESELNPCRFGAADSPVRVVLAGDLHAANWIPAFEEIAASSGWAVETHTKSACPVMVDTLRTAGRAYDECREWGERVLQTIEAEKPDMVVLAMSAGARLNDQNADLGESLRRMWARIEEAGTRLVLIADTPRHKVKPAECIEADPACVSPRAEVMRPDPMIAALKGVSSPQLVDMNDGLCTENDCPIVIGNVVVWRDAHHLTATYSRMLAPYLAKRLPTPGAGS